MGEVPANCQHFNLNTEILKAGKHTEMNAQTQGSQEICESKWISQCSEFCRLDDDNSSPSNYRICKLKSSPMIRIDFEV